MFKDSEFLKDKTKDSFVTLAASPDWLKGELELLNARFANKNVTAVIFTSADPAHTPAHPHKRGLTDIFDRTKASPTPEYNLEYKMAAHFGTKEHGISPEALLTARSHQAEISVDPHFQTRRGVIRLQVDEQTPSKIINPQRQSTPQQQQQLLRMILIHEVGHVALGHSEPIRLNTQTLPTDEQISDFTRKCRNREREADIFTTRELMKRDQASEKTSSMSAQKASLSLAQTSLAKTYLASRTLVSLETLGASHFTSLAIAREIGYAVPEGNIDELDANATAELISRTDRDERMRTLGCINDPQPRRQEIERCNVEERELYGRAKNRKQLAQRIERIEWLLKNQPQTLSPEAKLLARIALESSQLFGLHPAQQKRNTFFQPDAAIQPTTRYGNSLHHS